jgi:V/A-type H+-transporting ATPase subunit E
MAGGVDKIIAQIEKTAEGKVADILAKAREKAEALLAEAREQAAEQERATLARGEQESRRESQRILAEARIQARRACVKAQEDTVKQAFAQAMQALQTLADSGAAGGSSYPEVLKSLIVESIAATDSAELEVLVRQADHALLTTEYLNAVATDASRETGRSIKLTLAAEAVVAAGGAMVRSLDGRVRVDNTFKARTALFMDAIRTRVAKELFVGE